MRRRVVLAIMTVTTVVIALFAVPLAIVFGRFVSGRAATELEHHADLVARSLDLTSTADPPDATDLPAGRDHLAVYTPDGSLRFGDGPNRLEPALLRTQRAATVTIQSHGSLITTAPVVSGEEVLGIVRAERSHASITRTTFRLVGFLAAGAFAVLAVGWLIARRIARSLAASAAQLTDAAVRLGGGDFTVAGPTTGIAELDTVGLTLEMTARQLDDLVAREQAFSADASHQLRTPIAGLRAAIETELAYPRNDRQLVLHEALADVGRLETTVDDLLALARRDRHMASSVDASAVATDARERWASAFARAGRPLVVDARGSIVAAGHPALLRQALDALLDNALNHGHGTTTMTVESSHDAVTIIVGDEGDGLTETSPRFNGAGLGLPLIRRLVAAQGGRFVVARSTPAPRFHVVLHVHRAAETPDERSGTTSTR